MTQLTKKALLAATLLCAPAVPPALAQVTLSDGDFDSWIGVYKGPAGSNAVMEVLPTSGNPDACIEATTMTGPLGWLLMWSPDLSWDLAAQGPLVSVSFRIDFQSITNWGQGQGIRPAIIQDGRVYLSRIHEITGTNGMQWTTMDENYAHWFPTLGEHDFIWVPDEQFETDQFPVNACPPDLGPEGSPLVFGFVIANRASGTYQQLYDNYEVTLTPATDYEIGLPFCSGDGSGSACPCDNENDGSVAGGAAGCANGFRASGARLHGTGSHSLGRGSAALLATGIRPGRSTMLFRGSLTSPFPFGDGLRCVGAPIVRLGLRTADGSGSANWGPDAGSLFEAEAGDVHHFQVWYRDGMGSPCGALFNLTNGTTVCWTP